MTDPRTRGGEGEDSYVNNIAITTKAVRVSGLSKKSLSGVDCLSFDSSKGEFMITNEKLTPIVYDFGGVPSTTIQPSEATVLTVSSGGTGTGTKFISTSYDLEKAQTVPVIFPKVIPDNYPLKDKESLAAATEMILLLEDDCPVLDSNGNSCTADDSLSIYNTLASEWTDTSSNFNMTQCQFPNTIPRVTGSIHLANRRSAKDPTYVSISPGTTYHIRAINGATLSNYEMQLPFPTKVVGTDGHWIEPYDVTTSSAWIGAGQSLDLLLTVPENVDQSKTFALIAVRENSKDQSVVGMNFQSSLGKPYSNKASTPSGPYSPYQEKEFKSFNSVKGASAPQSAAVKVGITGLYGFSSIDKSVTKIAATTCVTFVNYNQDSHSLYLGGKPFQVTEVNGVKVNGPVRDTVVVPAGGCNQITLCPAGGDFDKKDSSLHSFNVFERKAGLLVGV